MTEVSELWPYLALILLGFLPNEFWRFSGLWLARSLTENSEMVVIARAIATALLTGIVAKLVVSASGALQAIPLQVRLSAAVLGFVAFLAIRRSVLAGVVVGEGVVLLWGLAFVS